MNRELIIKDYFNCWLTKDSSLFKSIFHKNIVYSECYGPQYHGLDTMEKWFGDWNKRGKVLVWDIKQFINQRNKVAVEWYFKCDYDNEISEFDGVSIIEFDAKNLIVSLKEFQSKSFHYCPYNNS